MKEKIKQKAISLGFHQVAFLPALPLPSWDEDIGLRQILDPSKADYWDDRGLTNNFSTILPDAKTIIIAAYPYQPYHPENFAPDQASYSAHYKAYPQGRKAMTEVGEILNEAGYKIVVDSPIPAKRLAYLGGIGTYGKNGLIYHPEFGSFITLHTIVTNAVFELDKIETSVLSDCGGCRICVDACPTGAIADNGVILVSKCIRHYMLSSDIVPVEIREKMNNRILGCEDCQLICPKNRKPLKQSICLDEEDRDVFNIREILSQADTGLKKLMIPISEIVGKNYGRPQRVLSMAVILAGNSGDPTYLPLLAKTLYHPHIPIRAHSAWALGKLGGHEGKSLLCAALKREQEAKVQYEIHLALGARGRF